MKILLKSISYLFHPILIPLEGSFIFFLVTRKHTSLEMQISNLFPIFILSVAIPIICILLLKNVGIINNTFKPSIKERKYLFYLGLILLFILVNKVMPCQYAPELYYYFIGLILAMLSSLCLLFIQFKASMHMMGIGSLVTYIVLLSVHFQVNLLFFISTALWFIGLAASSRLYFKANSKLELLVGLTLGILAQNLTSKYWL